MTLHLTDHSGRLAIVTGANSGLGLVTARRLAGRGARVILAVRNVVAGEQAARGIEGDVEVRHLDLASMKSVEAFSAGVAADHPVVDLLINNAGTMLLGPRRTDENGVELHLSTNLLGHFALTGLLLKNLRAAPAARVVNVSSLTHRKAHLDFADLTFDHGYQANAAYGRSKLASTIFGVELDRRLRATRSPVLSVLAHPGFTRTNLTPQAMEHRGFLGRLVSTAVLLGAQSAERGALPQLHAATDPTVRGGEFFGPSGRGELRGSVAKARISAEATDPAVGRRLWSAAEQLTGVSYL